MRRPPSFAVLIFVLLGAALLVSAAASERRGEPSPVTSSAQGHNQKRCRTLDRRREWRDLTSSQRLQYLQAVHCLHSRASNDENSAATTRFEQYLFVHASLTVRIHFVGQFLPWHRHLVTLYSNALKEECGYKGPTPYWDWSRDAHARVPLSKSPLFDPVTGFGGNGVRGTYTPPTDPAAEIIIFPGLLPLEDLYRGCVQDGPFRDTRFKVNIGPGRLLTKHCIVRGFDPRKLADATRAKIQEVMDASTFEQHWLIAEGQGSIHNAGHSLVGGEMTNVFSSPVDPIFYLHHAGLDRVWWKWQRAKPETRLLDIAGPTTRNGTDDVTLDFQLDYPGLSANVTIRDVMDSYYEPNCFLYD